MQLFSISIIVWMQVIIELIFNCVQLHPPWQEEAGSTALLWLAARQTATVIAFLSMNYQAAYSVLRQEQTYCIIPHCNITTYCYGNSTGQSFHFFVLSFKLYFCLCILKTLLCFDYGSINLLNISKA